jgi:glycosyltransferase involved in cell wall biosynthesis
MSRQLRPKPMTRRPTVTVVIPCYNYGHYLPGALETVLGQPDVDVEAIVIDDASPDGSGEVVKALAAADERIKPILHERNRGHVATYNEGLEQATGEYCVLMSADDALTSGALSRAAALLEAEPSVGLAYGFPVVFSDGLPAASTEVRSWTVWKGREWIEARAKRGSNCIYNPEVVLRTSVQHAIGGYSAELPHSCDLEMWLRAAAYADVGRVNGPGQAYYRVHADSMQRTVNAGHLIDLEGRLDAFRNVLVGPQARVAHGADLFDAARRALAITALGYARTAYDHARHDHEPVDAYVDFAARVWPEAKRHRRWRAVQARAQGDLSSLRLGITARARRLTDDLEGRIGWRWWRRYGM